MQFIVSQARKEGMISTGIDLFLAALPAVFIVVGYVSFSEPWHLDDEMTVSYTHLTLLTIRRV